MQNRYCVNGCLFNNSSNAHVHQLFNKWSCTTLFHCRYLYTFYMKNSLRFEISLRSNWPKWNLHRSEFHFAWTHMNTNNEVTLHRSEILPHSEISNESHVNVLLVITVFRNFCRVAFNVSFETTNFSSALNFHYNEKSSAEWASFWINFRKKTKLSFKSQLCLFPLSKVLQNFVNICIKWI